MIVLLIYNNILTSSETLLTTHYKCDLWKQNQLWKKIGYRTECISFSEQDLLISKYCSHKPNYRIQYSDISRLLAIYERGGWYVDSDVVPTPLCAKLRYFNETLFGLESNFASMQEAQNMGMVQKSIAMWAFYGKRHDIRLLKMACKLSKLSTRKRRKDESLDRYIHSTSGPTQYSFLWSSKTLPVSVFGCGQSHSGSPPCNTASCWGCHKFRGSWRVMS